MLHFQYRAFPSQNVWFFCLILYKVLLVFYYVFKGLVAFFQIFFVILAVVIEVFGIVCHAHFRGWVLQNIIDYHWFRSFLQVSSVVIKWILLIIQDVIWHQFSIYLVLGPRNLYNLSVFVAFYFGKNVHLLVRVRMIVQSLNVDEVFEIFQILSFLSKFLI